MWIAVFNNIPELVLGGTWTGFVAWTGYRLGKWRQSRI